LIAVGRITDAYGLKGWVKIQPYGVSSESVLLQITQWWLSRPARPGGTTIGLHIRQASSMRAHNEFVLAKIEGIDLPEAAESHKGVEISVRRSQFPQAADGEYYWVDLVGCKVINREQIALGSVLSVDDHGAHPILAIQTEAGDQLLIPFVPNFIGQVSIAARQIVVDWQLDY
jgi:16S rRNA processing protein RimM